MKINLKTRLNSMNDQDFDESQKICGVDFISARFNSTGANKVEFEKCNFSYARFNDAYFSDCTFYDCNFTGTKFIDSNFRNSKFDQCSLLYAEFKNTYVQYSEIEKNLPLWPNVRQRLLQNLRKNFEGLGDRAIIKVILSEELEASSEYFKEAKKRKASYYIKEYNTFGKRMRLRWRCFKHHFSGLVWGHGEYPLVILFSSVAILLFISALLIYQNYLNHQREKLIPFAVNQILEVFITYLGVSKNEKDSIFIISTFFKSLIITVRYLSLGLFTSSMARRHSWR